MRKKFRRVLTLLLACTLGGYLVFVGFAFADGDGGPLKTGRNKVSFLRDMLSSEQVVLPEQMVSLPEALQNVIDFFAVDQETAEKVKDNVSAWVTKQRDRMMQWRVHTLTDY